MEPGEQKFMRQAVLPLEARAEIMSGYEVLVSEQPLGVGEGSAHAEISTPEEAMELARVAVKHLHAIDPEASTGCGDGRDLIEVEGGGVLPVSPKLFGAGPKAGLDMDLLSGNRTYTDEDTYEGLLKEDTATLKEGGRTPAAHIDSTTDVHGPDAHCKSLDAADVIFSARGIPANAAALKPLAKYFTEELIGEFDENAYDQETERAAAIAGSRLFRNWNGNKGVQIVRDHDGVVRVLNAQHPTIENDPAHNHRESVIFVILREGIGLDKEAFIEETGKMGFVLTMPQLKRKAEILAAATSEEAMQTQINKLVQAGVTDQLAHALVVPDGSQYLVVIK